MWPIALLTVYCVCLVIASLVGGWLPSIVRLTHTRMQLMMSLVGGLMLGVALLHMLPHAVVETGSLDTAAGACLIGLLAMFLIIRVFSVHHHCPEHEDVRQLHQAAHGRCVGAPEAPEGDDRSGSSLPRPHRFSWIGLFVGLGIHTLIDGIAVSASVMADGKHIDAATLLGAGTFLAVLLHKPLDSLSLMSVMVAGGWSDRLRKAVNGVFSVICPLGALLFFFGMRELSSSSHVVVGCALGFSAGVFLCISLADILPEIQFHRHDRVILTATLLLGVALAYGIGLFEPSHAHQAPSSGHVHDEPAGR